ncbi:hypothetical protein QZH41_016045 [Actinostola sp. cb2023]|nr:hypothetical protein QZH41_016045 [Actinostola sp. cb2023]
MNPDLVRERSKASFKVEDLTNVLDGGIDKTARRRHLENIIIREPLFDRVEGLFMDRDQGYESSLQKGLRFIEIQKEHNVTDPEELYIMEKALEQKSSKRSGFPWQRIIALLGRMPRLNLVMVRTNIRALETTATYDKATKEFVMHSPQQSACKWWPGYLAHSSTHAIVVAKLIVDGEEHGIHFFIMQLRDLTNHKPLPGITVGDIGPKASGYLNASDNGFLMLDHVHIPRENMLMGLTKVSPEGKVSQSGNPKVLYGTMMYVRASIPTDIYGLVSRAITIAIRYSAVRRQSELKPGYLLKCVSVAQGGQTLPPTVAYLKQEDNGENMPAFSMEQFLNPSIQLQILQMRSRRMIYTVAQKMQAQVMTGIEQMDAWNAYSPDLIKCAEAHSFYLVVLYSADFLRTGLGNTSIAISKVLKSLCDLYILHGIAENSGSYLEVS